jgi:hypothetical protein
MRQAHFPRCFLENRSLGDAIPDAQGKAAGIFPADLARVLLLANREDWDLIRSINPPDTDQFL